MGIDWDGGVERAVMEEYRAQWFGDDYMEIDSFDFQNSWWKGPPSKTLPCTSVRALAIVETLSLLKY